MQAKTHTLTITVTFDRPCSKSEARAMVADNIHGAFYPVPLREDGPEKFKVRSIKSAPSAKQPSLPTHSPA